MAFADQTLLQRGALLYCVRQSGNGVSRGEWNQQVNRLNTAIPDQDAPSAPGERSPNGEWSKVDYAVHAGDVHILGRQPVEAFARFCGYSTLLERFAVILIPKI